MAKDMEVEDSAKENQAATTEVKDAPVKEDKPEDTAPPAKDPYLGKYNWDVKEKKNKKAEGFTLPSGVISDYAWADGKKAVSIYVTLKGLDSVSDDDLNLSLSKDKQGLSFKVKNLEGKRRFLTIEKLNKKVKSTKLIRKKGRDQVVLKLFKEDEKTWYSLKSSSGGSSYNDFGDWSDDEASIDPLEDVVNNEAKEEAKEEDTPMKDAEEKKEEQSEKKDESDKDVPMENAEDKKAE
jgi:hypothetical protein